MPLTLGLHRRSHPDHHPGRQWPVVGVIAVGGAAGAAARYGAERLWPVGPGTFPWTILLVNVVGCFLMGLLMVAVKERFTGAPRLVSPMLGTGVLGGFTTFSHYIDGVRTLFDGDQIGYGFAYLVLTPAAALAAVALGVHAARPLFRSHQHPGRAAR